MLKLTFDSKSDNLKQISYGFKYFFPISITQTYFPSNF